MNQNVLIGVTDGDDTVGPDSIVDLTALTLTAATLPPMKIATWNVNSIKVRAERMAAWLESHSPDVLCLQELKLEEKDFPRDGMERLGYHAAIHGQKTYNGVAIVSKSEPKDVRCGFDDGSEKPQARLIAATVGDVQVLSAYFVNGQKIGSDKYAYKLEWLRRLREHIDAEYSPTDPVVLCGDFNIAPEPRDVHDPAAWEGTVLFNDEMRAYYQGLIDWGFVDTYRQHHDDEAKFSWWDYRMLAFPKNKGLRIDFVLASKPLADVCVDSGIDRDQRKSSACAAGTKPSDHVPVWATFER